MLHLLLPPFGEWFFVADLSDIPASMTKSDLRVMITALQEQNEALLARVAALEAQVGKNSRNSSKPPSSDSVFKKPPPKSRSLRTRSGKKPGKQPGSPGTHLQQVDIPDEIVVHTPSDCASCGTDLTEQTDQLAASRQVFDLPVIRAQVTEHRAVARTCSCGHTTTADFPAGVTAPSVYGPRLRALAVFLTVGHHVPVARAAQIISEALDVPVSTGWIAGLQSTAADVLEASFIPQLQDQLRSSDVVHFDETGARVQEGLAWIHTAVTDTLTSYHVDPKRGRIGMDAHGVLPNFTGVAVHDGFSSYRQYDDCDHGLCNAHLLRELIALEETSTRDQAWASQMATLLVQLHRRVQDIKAAGGNALDDEELTAFRDRYSTIVEAGKTANPPPPRTGTRGRPALGVAGSLVKRFAVFKHDVLRFATDFRVAFDNNLAERAIRMIKLQLKISGSWRTWTGIENFLTIRSYVATAKKHDAAALDVLTDLFQDKVWALPTT